MFPGVKIDLAKHYILDRLCPSGGFCHYGLDEPNLHDTWHALAGLRILGVRLDSGPTVRFLRSFQGRDGSFRSAAQAYYALLGLDMLGAPPSHDPARCIAGLALAAAESFTRAQTPDAAKLEDTRRLVALQRRYDVRIASRENIVERIMLCRNGDGGFGSPASSLTETLPAVEILHNLGLRADAESAAHFVRSCDHPVAGFTDMPGTSLHYIEHVHAGLALCLALRIQPGHASACAASVRRCQLVNGGFARASLGIANLEYTYLALHSLQLLKDFKAK